MDTLPEGDGLAPLVSVDVRRGSAMSLGLRHRVLPGGGRCDHWIWVEAGRQRRELEDARGLGHENHQQGFPGSSVVKNLPANAGDTGSIPGPGRYHMLWSS